MKKKNIVYLFGIIIGICLIYVLLHQSNVFEFFESNNDFRILNLVLYSSDNGGPYDEMKKITEKYYKLFPYVDTYYYAFSSKINGEYELNDNVLYINGEESYIPGILKKTISAFEFFKDKLDNYRYIMRSNISTIIRFDLLKESIKKKEKQLDYGCALCFDKDPIPFSSGTSILLSPKIIRLIINNKDKIDYSTIDDVAIGDFVLKQTPHIKMEVMIKNKPNNGFFSVPNLHNDKEKLKDLVNENIVFYRNRNDERDIDVKQMKTLVEILTVGGQ